MSEDLACPVEFCRGNELPFPINNNWHIALGGCAEA